MRYKSFKYQKKINKQIFKNYKYDVYCKDQNANKRMKFQI